MKPPYGKVVFAFEMDGILRNVRNSRDRCVSEAVAYFDPSGGEATCEEMILYRLTAENWHDMAFRILEGRGVKADIERDIRPCLQEFYTGDPGGRTIKKGGYIECEQWQANNVQLERLKRGGKLAIVSKSSEAEIEYTLAKSGTDGLFRYVAGGGQIQGLLKLAGSLGPEKISFCDCSPDSIRAAGKLELPRTKIEVYGIVEAGITIEQEKIDERNHLRQSGALGVYENIDHYCSFLESDIKMMQSLI